MSEVVYNFSLNFPAGSLPNLGVSYHLAVNGNSVASKHPIKGPGDLLLLSSPHLQVPFLHLGLVRL